MCLYFVCKFMLKDVSNLFVSVCDIFHNSGFPVGASNLVKKPTLVATLFL